RVSLAGVKARTRTRLELRSRLGSRKIRPREILLVAAHATAAREKAGIGTRAWRRGGALAATRPGGVSAGEASGRLPEKTTVNGPIACGTWKRCSIHPS